VTTVACRDFLDTSFGTDALSVTRTCAERAAWSTHKFSTEWTGSWFTTAQAKIIWFSSREWHLGTSTGAKNGRAAREISISLGRKEAVGACQGTQAMVGCTGTEDTCVTGVISSFVLIAQ
jgi:hypothetical protein